MEIILLLVGLCFAFCNRSIAKSKGYQGRWAFVGGLTLGLISTIYTLLQPKTLEKQVEEMKLMKEFIKD